jgi:hypothetical protein
VGKLEEIVARNKQPFRLQGTRSMIVRGVFLLLILALFLFTSWASPPPDHRPGINVTVPKDPAVRDVKLYRAPPAKKSL